jgi:Tfp pilus assembly protein PilO
MGFSSRQAQLRLFGWLLHGAGLMSVALTALTFYLIVVRWCVEPRADNEQEAARLAKVFETASEVFRQHRERSEELAQLERNAQTIRERIPDQAREAEFLSQVTRAAEDVKLRVLKYQCQGVQATETHFQFDIRLDCHGSYASICGFLDRLSRLPRLSVVKQLSIVSRGNQASYPVDLTLTLYYRTGAAPSNG